MPNEHGEITKEDCKAPEGKFRVIHKGISDGKLNPMADFFNESDARAFIELLILSLAFVEKDPSDIFTIWDDQGNDILKMKFRKALPPFEISITLFQELDRGDSIKVSASSTWNLQPDDVIKWKCGQHSGIAKVISYEDNVCVIQKIDQEL